MWKKCGRAREAADSNIIWLMRIACWIPKSTNTQSEHVILSIAYPLYQWLHERASILHYTYSASLILNVYHVESNERYRLKIYVIDGLFFNVPKLYLHAIKFMNQQMHSTLNLIKFSNLH